MALWSNKTVQVPGLASVYASSGPITAESRRHYILDTTSNGITVNLPTGIDGQTIRISDAKGTFLTNNVTVVPAIGQKINNLGTNETLLLDANEMWIEFTWNALAGSWIVNAPGILGLIANTYTDYPYIASPVSPAASTLRLYAKSDGKLYTKDPAGSEKKVGGGLDHPTTGSTFEVDAYNISMTGTYNTGIGVGSLDSVTTGSNNTAIGIDCLTELQSSSGNVAIGYQAAKRLNGLGATNNVYIGNGAGTQAAYNNGGAGNVGIGLSPLQNVTSGYYNLGIGPSALQTVTSGFYNVGFGYNAGFGLSTGSYNTILNAGSQGDYSGIVVIGYDSAANKATASANNQFILGTSNHLYQFPGVAQTSLVLGPTGTSTGQTGTLSFRELAANGSNTVTLRAPDVLASDVTLTLPNSAGTNGQALITNGSGTLSWSTLIGLSHPTTESTFETGTANVSMTGGSNTAIGVAAGDAITSGQSNNMFGAYSASNLNTGSSNTAIGYGSLGAATSASQNVAIGGASLGTVVSGSYNVGIGHLAGYFINSNSSYNTLINSQGVAAGTALNGVVAIGSDSSGGYATVSANNQFVFGTSNHLYRFPGVAQTSLVLGPTGTSTGQTGTLSFRELAANGSNTVTLRAPDVLASDITLTLPDSAGTNGQFLTTNGSGALSWSSVNTSNSTVTITQNLHGFVAADVGRPVYLNGSTYTFAQADTETKAEVAGLINSIIDTNNFTLCLAGEVSSVGANLIDGGGSLVAGTMYFLSATTAGKITVTPPSVVGQIVKPVGIARTTSALDFYNMRGSSVGGSNVYTQISLSNNATTTIQNVSVYDSVELQGWIYLNATTKYRYLFKAQVTKKGDGTDYLVSFQHSGDTPPLGFNITVTAAGLVQVTLPSIAGFSSGAAQFSLNGPAVGASLPLQINSGLITPDGSAESPRGWTLSSNADYTFSASTSSRVRATATSANRFVNLPSTGIKAGYEAEIVTSCSGGYTIAIKSSNGNTIDTLKGDKGKIRLVALQDAPTTSAHWESVEVYDRGTWVPQLSGGTGGSYTMSGLNSGKFIRINENVTIWATIQWSAVVTPYSGNLIVAGLPFSSASGSTRCTGSMSAISGSSLSQSNATFCALIDPGYNYGYIIADTVGGGYIHTPTVASSGVIYGYMLTYSIA